jgi:hypothetical protein
VAREPDGISPEPQSGPDGTDAGSGSERRCVATRRSFPVDELIRFVAGPDGALVPDIRRKLPGRGVWTHASRQAVEQAVRARAFPRSLKAPVRVAPDLADEVDRLLARDCLQALAMANKAGQIVTGFSKVEAAVGRAAALVTATDAAADGQRKLFQALRRRHGEGASAIPVIECFASGDLALALGRDLVIHAALMKGAASEGVLARWRRLIHFRTKPLPEQALPAGADEPRNDTTSGPTTE